MTTEQRNEFGDLIPMSTETNGVAAATPTAAKARKSKKSDVSAAPSAEAVTPNSQSGVTPPDKPEAWLSPLEAIANLDRVAQSKETAAEAAAEAVKEAVKARRAELRAELEEIDRVYGPESMDTSAPASKRASAPAKAPRSVAKARPRGRMARRSNEEIEQGAVKILGLLKSAGPLRAENIRERLKLDKREMPKLLKAVVATKKVKVSGQKRATTYALR